MEEDLSGPALAGLAGAIERYRAVREAPDVTPDELFVPCVEGLWWARALDEHYDVGDYRTRRDADQCGAVLHGIRYARNRAGHGFISVLSLQEGATFPVRFPVRFGDFKWRPVTDLLHAETMLDRPGRTVYEQQLAGQPVTYALDDSLIWLRAEHDRRGARQDTD